MPCTTGLRSWQKELFMLDIRFWAVVMTCWVVFSPGEVQAQPAMDQRIRKVSAYYAAYYSKVYRVPVELVEAIIEVESRWHPEALSPKGAAGLMQLMPLTAQRFGV